MQEVTVYRDTFGTEGSSWDREITFECETGSTRKLKDGFLEQAEYHDFVDGIYFIAAPTQGTLVNLKRIKTPHYDAEFVNVR